jgi:hypothetical protein
MKKPEAERKGEEEGRKRRKEEEGHTSHQHPALLARDQKDCCILGTF